MVTAGVALTVAGHRRRSGHRGPGTLAAWPDPLLPRGDRGRAAAGVRARRQGRPRTGRSTRASPTASRPRSATSGSPGDHGTRICRSQGRSPWASRRHASAAGTATCSLDSHNALYFSDLQGLTNISDSVSRDGGRTWSTNCAGAGRTRPDDRMWFAGTGSLAKHNLILYQDYDVVGGITTSGEQRAGGDGVHRRDHVPSGGRTRRHRAATAWASPSRTASPATRASLATRSSTRRTATSSSPTRRWRAERRAGVRVSEGTITAGARPRPRPGPRAQTWTALRLVAKPLTAAHVRGQERPPEEIAGENFATIARDSAGYLYVTFTAGPIDHGQELGPNFGALTRPEQIYVVHSLSRHSGRQSVEAEMVSAAERISGTGLSSGHQHLPVDHGGLERPSGGGLVPHRARSEREGRSAPAAREPARSTAPRA